MDDFLTYQHSDELDPKDHEPVRVEAAEDDPLVWVDADEFYSPHRAEWTGGVTFVRVPRPPVV